MAEGGEEGDDAVAAAAALVARLTSQVAALEGEVACSKGGVAACTAALEVQQKALAAVNQVGCRGTPGHRVDVGFLHVVLKLGLNCSVCRRAAAGLPAGVPARIAAVVMAQG